MGIFNSKPSLQKAIKEALPFLKDPEAVKAKKSGDAYKLKKEEPDENYDRAVASTIQSRVRLFSGCMDCQTSADVRDVSKFGLPPVSDTEKAGGACTNAMLSVLEENPDITFGDLLLAMQKTLKERGYKQIPQLSSSDRVNLRDEKFSVWHEQPNENRHQALLIGINYVGHNPGELNGCINDVKMMKNFLVKAGYSPDNIKVLLDDPAEGALMPTGKNIVTAINDLVSNAQPGDSLFVHYSGHGGQMPDPSGDEADGMDETLIPVDFKKNGQITDDTLFQLLIGRLPENVSLVCVFDCCHSGSILDLPYTFSATEEAVEAIQAGEPVQTQPNPGFNLDYAKNLISSALQGLFNQLLRSKTKGPGAGGIGKGELKGALMGLAKQFFKK